MITERVDNWPKHLTEAVETAEETAFAWGTHDCCIMAANIIKAVTGVDLAEDYRGTYTSKSGAATVIARKGGSIDALAESFAEEFTLAEGEIAYAQRGDVMLIDDVEGATLGVCLGVYSVFPNIDQNIILIPTEKCRRTWEIGR